MVILTFIFIYFQPYWFDRFYINDDLYLVPSKIHITPESHALYLSVIQINHEPDTEKAQINIKVFTDDLQSALRNAFEDYPIVPETELCEKNQRFFEPYFSKHFKCTINGEPLHLNYKNCQKENDVYWLTFEMSCPKNWTEVLISADFFMELFPTQTNVLSLSNVGEKRFCRMTKKESLCETVF